MHVGLIKNFTADGPIGKRRLVTFGSAEGRVALAGIGAVLLGTTAIRGAAGTGERIDVCLDHIREVEFGGTVAYGDPLTSDANGRAIKAAPGAGASLPIIGRAMSAGGLGVIGHVLIQPATLRG
ncbi:hypothetical protein [Pannonibacter sp. SL95]|uniref:hypothetical protein n=1 Tax=Pannonibacter sp. SL95 TaxID=2995153 RepID=UPI00227550AA|nr:hypothetical protein [Pannonibacter sp. SL95]MCY1704440.1 hypothetical protein [Pannonibacter sp. SL95]MCY1704527.1 hypothetical protein [Pannonibacter sp. SL95]MCY1706425.1 hypothetical protein [Pannonibacter sp. SL95]